MNMKHCNCAVQTGPFARTDKFTLLVYCNFLVLLSTTVCSQNINKQIVNKAYENLSDYSVIFLFQFYVPHCNINMFVVEIKFL